MTGPSDQFDYLYSGDDDVKATELMAKAFSKTSLEWDVDLDEGEKIFVLKTSGSIFLVNPVTFKDTFDFLQFTFINVKKDGVTNSNKAYLTLLNDFNQSYRRLQFSIDDDGDLRIKFFHQFRNRLSTDDIKELVEIVENLVTYVFTNRNEDLAEFLK